MRRLHPGIPSLAAAGAALLVLYGIGTSPVHVRPQPALPHALSALIPDTAPQAAPGVRFRDAAGRPVSLAAFKGRLVILDLWARWCAPCVGELPALGRLQAALGPQRFAVVAVDEDHGNAADSAAFLNAHGAGNLAVYRDPDLALLEAFGAQGLPFSVVIDRRGREIARASGPMKWDDSGAIAYFKAMTAAAAQ